MSAFEEGRRAPSLSFNFNDDADGETLLQDVYVPSTGLTPYTYYCCLQWNAGQEGGGYCGIQDHPRGRNFIFSIWDPKASSEAIQAVHTNYGTHPGTECEKFGGEGTGLRSLNFALGWNPDTWYTLIVRRWDQNGHTHFGFLVKDHNTQSWTQLVTMDYPVPDVYFMSCTGCFLEDWHGSGENARRVHFRNGYKGTKDKTWIPFNKSTFHVNNEDSSRLYANNIDAGTVDGGVYLQSGGGTAHALDLSQEVSFETSYPETPPIMSNEFQGCS